MEHRRNATEVNLKDLTPVQVKQFEVADETEWQAILQSGAVRVVSAAEALSVRRRHPDRVLSSRMVRRLKPQEGVGTPPKAKSRWCVHGHQDPDTEHLQVYAPTPQSESTLLFLQVMVSHGFRMQIADFKNAFCQSHKLSRSHGPLYVQPCKGLPREGELIELIVPVYGLDDAPLEWHKTITTEFIEGLGYRRSLLEPCWFIKQRDGVLIGNFLVRRR